MTPIALANDDLVSEYHLRWARQRDGTRVGQVKSCAITPQIYLSSITLDALVSTLSGDQDIVSWAVRAWIISSLRDEEMPSTCDALAPPKWSFTHFALSVMPLCIIVINVFLRT